MINNESTFLLGYVEQAVAGGDPLNPPISISKNGTLAKWRGKFDFLDLRVNDPGLQHHKKQYEDYLVKAGELGIETVITLPEFVPVFFEMAPEMPSDKPEQGESAQKTDKPAVKRNVRRRPEQLIHFKNCYPALPEAVNKNKSYKTLSMEDCLPIVEMASEHDVKHIIVPISEPGLFIDPQTEPALRKFMKELTAAASQYGIKLHVRNGGLPAFIFKHLKKETGCGLAYDIGMAQLEGEDFTQFYNDHSDDISIILLQQGYRAYDKWVRRKEDSESALRDYVEAMKDYKNAADEGDEEYKLNVLKRWNDAYGAYIEASRNQYFNLGLFQAGDLNLVPLLKEVRRDIERGDVKYVLVNTVPNTRNNDFVLEKVLPGNFSISF